MSGVKSPAAPPPRVAQARETASDLRRRLLGPPPVPVRARWAWLGVVLATVVGGALRFFRLGHPAQLVFDETYYVKQGWSLMRFGYERDIREGLEEPDELFTAGDPDVFGSTPDLVVHPPVGKWMLGV